VSKKYYVRSKHYQQLLGVITTNPQEPALIFRFCDL